MADLREFLAAVIVAWCVAGCGGAQDAAPETRPPCTRGRAGRVLSVALSLQPVGEGSTPAPALTARSSHGAAAQALPAEFAGDTDLDIAGSGASLVHLRVPERFVLDEDARIECGEGCSSPAHYEAGADGAPGSLEADVPLPPDLGGPHHVVHVHAPAEITEGDCH